MPSLDYIANKLGPKMTGRIGAPFIHTQSSPSADWTVNHNLGRKPAAVEVLSPGGVSVNAEIVHTSDNQLHVLFSAPQTGSVLAQ